MANKSFVAKLRREERERLDKLIRKGKTSAKIILKARILNLSRARHQRRDGGPGT